MDAIYFWLFGTIAVVASVLVVGQRNPMYSVLLLIVSFGALSALYILLNAPFVAAIQIIIYAGAIMVLFLFVVMLLNVRSEDAPTGYRLLPGGVGPRRVGAVLAFVLAIELVVALSRLRITALPAQDAATAPSVYQIGVKLFGEYAFAFEVTSVLILVAMVGAVILARREPVAETEHETRVEIEAER